MSEKFNIASRVRGAVASSPNREQGHRRGANVSSRLAYRGVKQLACAIVICGAFLSSCAPTREPSSVYERGKVTLGTIKHGASPEAHALEFDDTEIVVDSVLVVVSDVELHSCKSKERERARFSLISEAHAHVPDSATRLGTPFVEDLLGAIGRASIVSEIAPPLGDYCSLWVIIAPADDDILNPTSVSARDLVGQSVIISGRQRTQGDDVWQKFTRTSSLKRAFEVPIAPIKLSREKDSAFVLIDKTLDQQWWEDLDPSELVLEHGAEYVLSRYLERLERYTPKKRTN